MADEHVIKLVMTTAAGRKIKVPTTIKYEANRIWFVKSPFALKDEIKAMKGARWHGYDPNEPKKIWSVYDCERNHFQLQFMMGQNPYEWWDQPLRHWEYDRPLRTHQELMSDHMLTYHYCIIAAEMGCVDGDAVVHVNRAGKGFKITLAELYKKWRRRKNHNGARGQKVWDSSIPTYVRSLKDSHLGLHLLTDVLKKGNKAVVKLTLASGKSLRLTPDHEVCVASNKYQPVETLCPGDIVLSNGKWIDKDGYVRVGGLKGEHSRWTTGGVYEHILIAEEMLGRSITIDEVVHHKNGIKHDNRSENLEVLEGGSSEHARKHGCQGNFINLSGGHTFNGGTVWFVPEVDTVVSVELDGECEVYDLVMADPHRNFVANGVVVHNCGKTLSAIECMEQSGHKDFWWIGPKSALKAVQREFYKWGLSDKLNIEVMTYERLRSVMKEWKDGDVPPPGVVFDESSRLKGSSAQRTVAAQNLADSIRDHYGKEGFVIEMSGTPSPKSPLDWWAQAEIAWPGFLREGDAKSFERRMGIFVEKETMQGKHLQRVTWLDDENKCKHCGGYEEEEQHNSDFMTDDYHVFEKSFNEVEYLNERLGGLTLMLALKDCVDLPEMQHRIIRLEPSATLTRVAKALVKVAPNAMTGLTWMRELSDGFQYQDIEEGTEKCPLCEDGTTEVWVDPEDSNRVFEMVDMLDADYVKTLEKKEVVCPRCKGEQEVAKIVRITKEIPCPKDDAVRQLLEENEEQGRLVIFAGFKGSIDRIVSNCLKNNWAVVRVDGRGWKVYDLDGNPVHKVDALDYWADLDNNVRVAFVAHPRSGGLGLTLTESRMAVFYSNDFNGESRSQAMARIHRIGMDENNGAIIVDLFHLPTDEKVHDRLKENRKLELMVLGDLEAAFDKGSD